MSLINCRYLWPMNYLLNKDRAQGTIQKCLPKHELFSLQVVHLEDSGSIHTTPEIVENAALFLRLCLPVTLIRHGNAAFHNGLQTGSLTSDRWKYVCVRGLLNWRSLKMWAFLFVVNGEHFKKEPFENNNATIIK